MTRCAYTATSTDRSAVVRCTKKARTVDGFCKAHGKKVLHLAPPLDPREAALWDPYHPVAW